ITADKIVVWNSHDGRWHDRGTLMFDLLLGLDGKVVWARNNVTIAWDAKLDPSVTVPLPRVRFDTVRVVITKHKGYGAILSEIEVYADKKNIALNRPTRASAGYRNSKGNISKS